MKLHSLHRESDATKIKHAEKIQDFVSRVLDVVYHIKMMKEKLSEKAVVAKILRSLTPRFTHVVSSIIEVKNLNTLTIDKLSGSLKSHESILNLAGEQEEEKALHVKSSPFGEHSNRGGRGHG